jgi:ubiquinone/menaquinone biosynthesis C-methylase UbiE
MEPMLMKSFNFDVPDLITLYSQPYDAEMERWRKLGAVDKAANVAKVCESVHAQFENILEVGCGTGAVLEELARQWAKPKFSGVEIGYTRSKPREWSERRIDVRGYDGVTLPYGDSAFDLVYATHVLEHVIDERHFLGELRRVAKRHVFVEVPCELHLRASYKNLQPSLNIGHINAYTPESFVLTLETSGLHVEKIGIFDHSYQFYRFYASSWKAILKMAARRLLLGLNETLASRFFTYHVGALCTKAPMLAISSAPYSTLQ